MKKSCYRSLVMVCFGFAALSTKSYALTYGEAVGVAKELPKSYMNPVDHGKLCEILGVQVMQELHPNATIMNGVEYKKNKRVIGELDLVVIENNVVTEVTEVKCMKSYRAASNKADVQLDRFAGYIGRCDVDFSLQGKEVPCDVFANQNIKLGKMSYLDAMNSGFDQSFSLTRTQVLQLIKDVKASK